MTPEETREDAVQAAREWRVEQRERMPLPAAGELVPVRWPGADHDFLMKFAYEDASMSGAPDGWVWLHGQILKPETWHNRPWSFMVHLVDGGWTLLPKGGKLSDVEP